MARYRRPTLTLRGVSGRGTPAYDRLQMDLYAFIRVLWRFRTLLAAGLLLATLLAAFSLGKVTLTGGKPAMEYRDRQVYVSAATLLVTQEGFPWGRAILDDMITIDPGDGAEPISVPRFGDPGRYSGLASLYAELAKGDTVQRAVLKGLPPGSSYEPAVVKDPDSGSTMPMLYLKGYGSSPRLAAAVADRAAETFIRYLRTQQRDSAIAADKRIQLVITQHASPGTLFKPRSYVRRDHELD